MKKVDYNIEFAHIYADEAFGKEQIRSAEILKEIISKLKKQNKTYVISILIDEFHPVVFKLDEKTIIKKCKKLGINIDFVGYESKLGIVGDQLIKEIPKSDLKIEHFHKPEKEVVILEENHKKIGLKEEFNFMYRHTCALLSTSWSLCRLGTYNIPPEAIHNLTNKPFEAKKLITILPEKFHPVENKVLEIIKSTKFKTVIKNINYEFF